MSSAGARTTPKSSQRFIDASDVASFSSFSLGPSIALHSLTPTQATPSSSKWLPVERPSFVGRPLAYECDGPHESLFRKPSQSKCFFRKPLSVTVKCMKTQMFSDIFYPGASQIKAITLNQRSHDPQPVLSNEFVCNANDNLDAEFLENLVQFEGKNPLSAEQFCKGAVEKARSVSDFWRRRKHVLSVGGMPSDKTGLLVELTRLKSVIPPRLHPLKHKLVKGARPLKDESSTFVDQSEHSHCFDIHNEEVDFLRHTLTSSGLHPGSCSDDCPHPSFQTEKIFDSRQSSMTLQETSLTNTESFQSLGIFISAPRDNSSITKPSTRNWTPRRTLTPELKQTSSFSEPLKLVLKGAYDRRAADSMFCQLYLNEHVKKFETSKIEQIAVPASMQSNVNHDCVVAPCDEACAYNDKLANDAPSPSLNNDSIKTKISLTGLATLSKPTSMQLFADKMGRPPAKPNMAREHIKAHKETMKANALASIPRHKKLEWSALTPEEVKQKRISNLKKVAQDLNMPEGCWEVASWFR